VYIALKRWNTFLVLIASLYFFAPAFAETIVLKSGQAIAGKIIEKTGKYIKIDFYGVPLTYFYEEIDRIEKDVASDYKSLSTPPLSIEPLDSICNVLKEIGYSEPKAEEVASLLLPLSDEFTFRDIKNINTVKEDLRIKLETINTDILDKNTVPYPKHLKIFYLLTGEDISNLVQPSSLSSNIAKAVRDGLVVSKTTRENLFTAWSFFDCNYQAYIASVILKAKGLNIRMFTVLKPRDVDQEIFSTWKHISLQNEEIKHSSCLINIGNEYLIVDFVLKFVSEPFSIAENYEAYTNTNKYLKLKGEIQRGDLFKSIYIPDQSIDISSFYSEIGISYANIGDFSRALKFFQKSVEIDPYYAGGYYNLGNANYHSGNYEKALEFFQKSLQLDPDSGEAYENLAVTYNSKGEIAKAIQYLQKAIGIDPYNASAYYNLGTIYGTKGDYKEEMECYQKALKVNPDYAEAHYNLAVVYYQMKQYDLAITHCDKAKNLGLAASVQLSKRLEQYRK
jgi:tetratricopeptide (TPR) repeat protein